MVNMNSIFTIISDEMFFPNLYMRSSGPPCNHAQSKICYMNASNVSLSVMAR